MVARMMKHNPYSQLVECLQADGLVTAARKLDFLFREVSWNSPSDFLGSFGVEMMETKRACGDRMSEATNEAFSSVAEIIRLRWQDVGL